MNTKLTNESNQVVMEYLNQFSFCNKSNIFLINGESLFNGVDFSNLKRSLNKDQLIFILI